MAEQATHSAWHKYLLPLVAMLWLTGCNLGTNSAPVPTAPVATPLVIVATETQTPDREPTVAPSPLPPTAQPTRVSNALTGNGNAIYVRDNPSTMSNIIALSNLMTDWDAIGRSADGSWVQVRFVDGRTGWVITGSILIDTPLASLPITGQADNAANVVLVPQSLDNSLPLFDRPNDTVIAELGDLTPLRIDGRLADDSWLFATTNLGLQGWIQAQMLRGVTIPENVQIVSIQATPRPTSTRAPVSVAALESADAAVRSDASGLRLRQLPTTDSSVLFNMNAQTPLAVLGRIADNSWLLVEMPEGYQGWTSAAYLDINRDLNGVELINNPQPVPLLDIPVPENAPAVTFAGGGGARQIYLRGQQNGNRRNVFTTVGDSLTDTPYFLRHVAFGYNLREYGYLLPTIQFFNIDTGHGNAFSRRAISTRAGWSSFSTLDPNSIQSTLCPADESPVECEFRVVKPALALIMIGTNDAPAFTPDQYRANLTRIIQLASEYGVVPVLSTLPPRRDFNDKILAYNNVIRQLSRQYDIPLWDLHNAVAGLPNGGYGLDGIHLSVPPSDAAGTMDFTAENLRFGTTMRNLTALQTLKAVLENVMY